MKVTKKLTAVALVMMEQPGGRYWAYDLARRAHVSLAALYPMLTRMLDEGWVEDHWQPDVEGRGRPARRMYTLTEQGRSELGGIAAQAPATLRGRALGTAHGRGLAGA
ncbi:PadR family transcriptional regulator [Kineosporia succinea]|uniref:PadR family transcriptional regulator PadR n=1 Tax=Kineosporia succinea TaxID=84632 RepID=A0ABT9PA08_9ACTN|nr:helix-turn-helix transcriptional regulator [Kineosporia succinea]MDP9829526.1 PadR family transcriptional regulator PadR [Kineosporia succinea]